MLVSIMRVLAGIVYMNVNKVSREGEGSTD